MSIELAIPQLDFLCRLTVELTAPLEVGTTPLGERRVIPIVGGHVAGERLSGEVLPGGADWQLVRPDGAALLDARYTLRTHDGALIYVSNKGIRHGPPGILGRLRRGEEVDPNAYYFRTVPNFETAAPAYAWLNDVVAICSGMRASSAVILDVYCVS
jgi:hypothetical protein